MDHRWRNFGPALALLLVAGWTSAQGLVVDTPYVETALKSGALVWDARDESDYLQGHIPGAVNIGNAGDVFRDANREDPPSAAAAATSWSPSTQRSVAPAGPNTA